MSILDDDNKLFDDIQEGCESQWFTPVNPNKDGVCVPNMIGVNSLSKFIIFKNSGWHKVDLDKDANVLILLINAGARLNDFKDIDNFILNNIENIYKEIDKYNNELKNIINIKIKPYTYPNDISMHSSNSYVKNENGAIISISDCSDISETMEAYQNAVKKTSDATFKAIESNSITLQRF